MFRKIRKRSSLCGFDWKTNLKKRAEAMEKNMPEPKTKFVCMCVREKQQQFLRYIRNINTSLKKDFQFAELFTKTSFPFTLETVLKMAKETN